MFTCNLSAEVTWTNSQRSSQSFGPCFIMWVKVCDAYAHTHMQVEFSGYCCWRCDGSVFLDDSKHC